ncbi:protein SUPPRESSOR OF QUENCHING 1 [Citrus sinensis]|uniref:Protein SUPPRESSOR OF QUENCHING 1 n=1 Tax=Citrus sinensis TaxID=2711 RepID=A0ACB8KME8_CITSI|nr:protein SUPPRESSOR OF QUENCHING 1 [Citrus sinensis]
MIAMKLLSSPPASSLSLQTKLFFFSPNTKQLRPSSVSSALFQCGAKRTVLGRRMVVKACVTKVEETDVNVSSESKWGKVSAVLFDMDGVLCNSEEPSRRAAVDVFAEMGVEVTVEDFLPFMGTGEANFLGGVASVKGVKGFDSEAAKKRFFEIYLDKCKSKGLKVAVASSADRIKVDANLAAAGLPVSMFDAIVSADAFENLKPAPDIFLSASKILNVPTSECIVIEDALAGVQAAKAAQMRCIAVTTTLSEERLKEGSPSLIRKEIGSVSLNDILTGGDGSYNEKIQEHELLHAASQNSTALPKEKTDNWSILDTGAADEKGSSTSGLQGSRREILRYGSLGVAFSCLFFAVSNWKAMQYASPKAIWNVLFGVNRPSFEQTEGGSSQSERIQQFVNYISDVENRKTTPIVPEFPAKLDWLNTAPLQFRRTWLFHMCLFVQFTVVGVHSAKFDNEKDLEAIHNAVLRYGISHPVVNDGDMNLWRELGVNSWPTFAVVGPNGKLLAQLAGEGHRKDLDDLVEAALLFYGKKKLLDNTPLPLSLEKDNDPRLFTSPLKFPGKLAIDILNNRLFISDSNHNRIVVTDLDGNFIVQIGSSGEEGLRDGSFDDATFNRPQGLAYNAKKNLLYVADTENHALREIDFVNDTVRTLAGNGTKGSDYQGGEKGTSQARLEIMNHLLNSPWDVCYKPINEKVYIAMAGQHQIWEHSTVDGVTRAFSGDGYERNLNGSSSLNTSFAQPSGISLSPDFMEIYVADSESSSIRALNLKTGGSRLLAGGDPIFPDNLFKFGDRDGMGSEVLLQHPLGVYCAKNGQIYVADSYNHKIKKLDPASNRVSTLAGIGKAGFKDGAALAAQLSEPAGIIEAQNGNLFIADTNNNIIRYLDLNKEEPELQTLELKGVQPPTPKSRSPKRLRRRSSPDAQTIVVDGGLSNEGNIYLKISLPEEYHFSKEARSKFSVDVEPENAVIIDPLDGNLSPEGSAVLHFRRMSPSVSTGRISCKVYYCKEDEVCLYKPLLFEVPFQEEVPNSPPAEITLPYDLKPKILTNSLQLPVAP